MAIQRIENQAVKLYSTGENTFNNPVDNCKWHSDYFDKVTCDDITQIVFNSTLLKSNQQNDGTFSINSSGTVTTTASGTLHDTGATFQSDGLVPGMIVRNKTTTSESSILTVDSEIQITLTDGTGFNLNDEYSITYYNMSGNFDITNGELVKTTGATGTAYQSTLTDISIYKVSIDITFFNSTSDGDQIRFYIGGNLILTLDETDDPNGQYIFYGVSSGIAAGDEFKIEVDANIDASFDNFILDKPSNLSFSVADCDTNAPVYLSATEDIVNNPFQNQLMASFDWSNLADGYECEGCYNLYFFEDPDENRTSADNINNGEFASSDDWILGVGWVIDSGFAKHTGLFSDALEQTNLANNFKTFFSYKITIVIDTFTGFIPLSVRLVNTTTSQELEIIEIGQTGTFEIITGFLSIDYDKIIFDGKSDGAVFIDSVSSVEVQDLSDYVFRTNCFKLATSHDCTIKLSGTNLDNSFGIDFPNLLNTQFVRVPGELRNSRYDGDKENEEDSLGVSKTLYFKSEKMQDVFIYQVPEYVHDFLRLLKGYDVFQINDVDYISENPSYEPEWIVQLGRELDVANSTMEVRKKTDLNLNKYC
jgi:hypothetical protein